jgi:AcrR family transcriptional regulator
MPKTPTREPSYIEKKTRAPQQARSQQSLDRILDATEDLLNDRSFDELTIQDVVKKAKASVGVFYSRFQDKAELLDALYSRHQDEMIEDLEQFERSLHEALSATDIIRMRIRRLLKMYRENRGLFRALVLRGHMHGDWRYEEPQIRNRMGVSHFGRLMEERSGELGHSNPKMAARLGFLSAMATLREMILFDFAAASAVKVSDKKLEDELVTMLCNYLEVS